MNIAFVWYWDRVSEIRENWRDGLGAAMDIIGKKHNVVWYVDKKIPDPKTNWDYILMWGDSNMDFFDKLDDYNCRKGICLSTSPQNVENLRKLDSVFCESEPVLAEANAVGLKAIKAFGTDTKFFVPSQQEKDIDYFYPATFSKWKRQSAITYLGDRLLCVGTVQPDGKDELRACKDAGVKTEVGYFPAEKILDYYQRAKNVIIPAIHGSERTVLEAMACNILPDVNGENIKTHSFIDQYMNSNHKSPRSFIMDNYSEELYAHQLLLGIEDA